jgi:hypothetical protein
MFAVNDFIIVDTVENSVPNNSFDKKNYLGLRNAIPLKPK